MLEQATLRPPDRRPPEDEHRDEPARLPPATSSRAACKRLRAIPAVREITLMTHFANADELEHPRLTVREQVRRFCIGAEGIDGPRSLSNSGGVLHQAELAAELSNDWVRPGIMLYGGTPGGRAAADFGLRPTMTLASEIIGVQDIVAGDTVGYGSRFEADRRRCASAWSPAAMPTATRATRRTAPRCIVDGVRTTLVGRVSMDMMTVDLTGDPGRARRQQGGAVGRRPADRRGGRRRRHHRL